MIESHSLYETRRFPYSIRLLSYFRHIPQCFSHSLCETLKMWCIYLCNKEMRAICGVTSSLFYSIVLSTRKKGDSFELMIKVYTLILAGRKIITRIYLSTYNFYKFFAILNPIIIRIFVLFLMKFSTFVFPKIP